MAFLRHYSTAMRLSIFLALSLLFLILIPPSKSFGNDSDSQEYMIKAGFIYKFIYFVEWPTHKITDSGKFITIGIIGSDPFGDAFKPIEGEAINRRQIVIKYFDKNVSPDYLKHCDLVFISSSFKENSEKILQSIREYPVLTVSEFSGFLEQGGMVNFIMKENRVRFEINRDAAERVGVTFRSKLLRVAERVVEDGHVR